MIVLGPRRYILGTFRNHSRPVIALSKPLHSNRLTGQICANSPFKIPYLGSLTARHMGNKSANKVCQLLLIRHGETTDNVAGLLGGSSDSPLTNHGFQQASRLGAYLAEQGWRFTHIFSSDLSRAFKTAEAIRAAQPVAGTDEKPRTPPKVVALKELQEQDFGSFERKPYAARYADSTDLRLSPDFRDIETTQSLVGRARSFLLQSLMPVLEDSTLESSPVVAVVSHGVLLTTLWRCILSLQRANTISLDPEVAAFLDLHSVEYIGGWSNTGHLILELTRLPDAKSVEGPADEAEEQGQSSSSTPDEFSSTSPTRQEPDEVISTTPSLSNFSILIKAVNSKEHLRGLKRTGGGVGSSKHDEGQRNIENFFKRRKPNE